MKTDGVVHDIGCDERHTRRQRCNGSVAEARLRAAGDAGGIEETDREPSGDWPVGRTIRWTILCQAALFFLAWLYVSVETFSCGENCIESVNARVRAVMVVTLAVEAYLTFILVLCFARWLMRR